MKIFLIRFILVLTPVLLFLVCVNYFGDVANLFSQGYEKEIAYSMLKGKNVTNVYNYNERLLQKFLINNSSSCPEVLIIGSSRVMLINSSHFKGKSFFNNGVSGASIEDLFAMIQMYTQKFCVPKRVIIGLDPWTLNANNGQSRWITLDLEYKRFSQLMSRNDSKQIDNFIKKIKIYLKKNIYYTELFSPSYFQGSLISLLSKTKPIETIKKENSTFTKISDGSINYDLEFRSVSKNELEQRISVYLNGGIYSVENFNRLDTNLQSKLEFMTNYLQSKNVIVEYFLTPYAPKVYSFFTKSKIYRQVIESEKYFLSIGDKYKVKIWGSFNPNILKMDNSYFYDGMHCNEKGIEKILMNGKE